jgi:hypothetical protein
MAYGGWAGGNAPGLGAGANNFGSIHYYEMPRIFTDAQGLDIGPSDVLVDVGCGKGRVINWWMREYKENRIYGLEILEDIARKTARRLRKYEHVTIIGGDALENIPPEGTIYWLFNPFTADEAGVELMRRLRDQLVALDHPVRVVLYRPRHVEAFDDERAWQVRQFRPKGLFYSVAIVKRVGWAISLELEWLSQWVLKLEICPI